LYTQSEMELKEKYLNSVKSWVYYSPWEWVSNYCNEEGCCWFQQYRKWILIKPQDAYNTITCLPYHINPFETPDELAQGNPKTPCDAL